MAHCGSQGNCFGCLAAGFLAALLSGLGSGRPLTLTIANATGILITCSGHDACRKAVEREGEGGHRTANFKVDRPKGSVETA